MGAIQTTASLVISGNMNDFSAFCLREHIRE